MSSGISRGKRLIQSRSMDTPTKDLKTQLILFWKKTLRCKSCKFPKSPKPQFRPVGNQYRPGGIVFVQINPGYIGGITKAEIRSKYRSERNRDIALRKLERTQYLQNIQEKFLASPEENWDMLCNEYFGVMQEMWGWPPGKYVTTIEAHGVNLDFVAIANLAQCPIQNDYYSTKLLDTCWQRTAELLSILQPRIIVAQGKTVFRFLRAKQPELQGKPIILRGVHHSARASAQEKQRILDSVRVRLNKVR